MRILILCVFLSGSVALAQTSPSDFAIILPSGVVPCTVHVHAFDVKLAHGTPLTARYQWDFGDPQGRFNTLAGWNAAHVYDRPGTYSITLALTDESGEKRTLTKSITITPDDRRKVFVSTSGNDANNGSDPSRAVRTVARAGKLTAPNSKLLFRRGDTFEIAESLRIAHSNVILGSYEENLSTRPTTSPMNFDERRPVIRYAGPRKYTSMISTDRSASDVTIEGLTFDSSFTKDAEVTNMPTGIKPAGVNTTIRNCRFLNVGDGFNGNNHPRGVLMQDCDAPLPTGIRGYLAWCQGSDLVFLGNYAINSTRQHTLRVGGADRLLIAHNNLSNMDRRSQGDPLDWNNGALTLREGSCVYVTDNIVNSGLILLGPLGHQDGLKDITRRWKWAVIERNRIGSWVQIVHGAEHVMIRNNVIRRNDWSAIEVMGYDQTYQRGVADVTIANNTGVNIGAKGYFLRVTGPVDGITLANNLYVAPKIPGAQDNSAAVWVAQRDLSSFRTISHNVWPMWKSGLVNFVGGKAVSQANWLELFPVSDDRFENVSLSDRDIPQNGAALQTGRPVPGIWEDIEGKPRPACSVGAVQMP